MFFERHWRVLQSECSLRTDRNQRLDVLDREADPLTPHSVAWNLLGQSRPLPPPRPPIRNAMPRDTPGFQLPFLLFVHPHRVVLKGSVRYIETNPSRGCHVGARGEKHGSGGKVLNQHIYFNF